MRQDIEAVIGGAQGSLLLLSQRSSDGITQARDAIITVEPIETVSPTNFTFTHLFKKQPKLKTLCQIEKLLLQN